MVLTIQGYLKVPTLQYLKYFKAGRWVAANPCISAKSTLRLFVSKSFLHKVLVYLIYSVRTREIIFNYLSQKIYTSKVKQKPFISKI